MNELFPSIPIHPAVVLGLVMHKVGVVVIFEVVAVTAIEALVFVVFEADGLAQVPLLNTHYPEEEYPVVH